MKIRRRRLQAATFAVTNTLEIPLTVSSLNSSNLEEKGIAVPEGYDYCRIFQLQVRLPKSKQRVSPNIAIKMTEILPELSFFAFGHTCGESEDFAKKLLLGNETWGHTFEHCLDTVLSIVTKQFDRINYGDGDTRWQKYNQYCPIRATSLYLVLLYSKEPLPVEFIGYYNLVCGWFNAIVHNLPFDLRSTIDMTIDYRTHKPELQIIQAPKGVIQTLLTRITRLCALICSIPQ